MIELPESAVIAKQLNDTVKGRRIADAAIGHTKHGFAFYNLEPEEYRKQMIGKTIGESRGLGAMVETDIGEYRFVAGDGANIRYYEAGRPYPARYQSRITFDDESALIFTVQMYGSMYLIKPEEYDNPYYLVAKEKPMPGSEEFDYEYFTSLREDVSGKLSAKAFLATEQRIPGLGNGVLQDILLESGLHPKKKISELRDRDWKQMYQSVIKILKQMEEAGGRDTEKDLFGEIGGYRTKLSKKTVGKGCLYCGNIIEKVAYLGGTIYYCPSCQLK